MTAAGLPAPPATGTEVTDLDAILLGYITGIYREPVTAVVQWAAIALPGSGAVVVVPLGEAIPVFGGIQVPYRVGHVQHAPPAPTTETLSETDLTAAIDYYYSTGTVSRPPADRAGDPPARTRTDGADLVLTRSEEQLRMETETLPVRRVRLRKYIVTEERTITVQLRHEEFRLEQEPITDPGAGTAASGGPGEVDTRPGTGDDQAVTMVLYAERPVISTEVVPVERIRVSKYVVTEEQTVSAAVRREVVEQLGDPPEPHPGPVVNRTRRLS